MVLGAFGYLGRIGVLEGVVACMVEDMEVGPGGVK